MNNWRWISLAILIGHIVFTVYYYGSLPDEIPHHFGLDGKVDRWGSKGIIWVMPGIAIFNFVLFYIVSRLEKGVNFPVTITPENRDRQFALMRTFLSIMDLITQLLLANITYRVIRGALGDAQRLDVLFYVLLFLLVIAAPIRYFQLAKRIA